MLIYARASDHSATPTGPSDPQPPSRALRVVEELNVSHERACDEFAIRFVFHV